MVICKLSIQGGILMYSSEAFGRLFWVDDELEFKSCLLYTSPSPRDGHQSRMPSSA